MNYIYLHGFASGPGSQKGQTLRERFAAQGIDLLIPDLAEGDFEHLTLTRQLAVIGRAAAGEPSVLIGSSMGGYLAALYAARHPEVRRVVLYAPAFGFPHRVGALLGPDEMERWRTEGSHAFFNYAAGKEQPLHYGLIEDARHYEEYPDVVQPVLIIHGTRDDHVPLALSQRFAAGRENVRLVTLDTDHQMLDALDAVWRETWAFLSSGSARG